jgi:hypothetical protein
MQRWHISYFSPKILREGSQLHSFAHESILRHEVVRYRAIFVFDDAIAFEGDAHQSRLRKSFLGRLLGGSLASLSFLSFTGLLFRRSCLGSLRVVLG